MADFLQIELASLGQAPRNVRFEANVEQRAALAARFELLDVPAFFAEVLLTRTREGAQMSANIEARVVQPCAVSLQPVESRIDEKLELVFVEQLVEAGVDSQVEDVDSEPIIDGILPVGEVLSQYFGLCVPPYPRAMELGAVKIERSGIKISSGGSDTKTRRPFSNLREIQRES